MNSDPDFDINDFIQRSVKGQEGFESGGPPSMEQFMEMLDNVKDMTDEEKEDMKKDLIMRAIRAAQMGGGSSEPGKFIAGPKEYMTFAVMIFVIVAVFGKNMDTYEILIVHYQSCFRWIYEMKVIRRVNLCV